MVSYPEQEPHVLAWRKRMLRKLPFAPQGTERCLDVGCGDGERDDREREPERGHQADERFGLSVVGERQAATREAEDRERDEGDRCRDREVVQEIGWRSLCRLLRLRAHADNPNRPRPSPGIAKKAPDRGVAHSGSRQVPRLH